MGEDAVRELIGRLSSVETGSAWAEFLGRYSRLIRHVVRRHEDDPQQAAECFDHVCAALSDEGFRRLRRFRPDGPARFTTWLMAVVSNLCVDWRRRRRGRLRPVRSVAKLPELDRQVYRCIFARGMSRADCVMSLAAHFPQLDEPTVAEISARLFGLLSPQQRWQLSARAEALNRSAVSAGCGNDEAACQVADPGAGPEELADGSQARERLYDALSRLPAQQRLLLRLRYEQGLTLAEVARLTRQPDPFRVDRQIRAAMDDLARLMGVNRACSGRKER